MTLRVIIDLTWTKTVPDRKEEVDKKVQRLREYVFEAKITAGLLSST